MLRFDMIGMRGCTIPDFFTPGGCTEHIAASEAAGLDGATTSRDGGKVVASRGVALVFDHGLSHEGAPVLAGTQCVMRPEVMFLE